jgi:hypothetical protein
MVLDSDGQGVGSSAHVDRNVHLTELVKMTFRKSDPTLVNLFLASRASPPPHGTGGEAGHGAAAAPAWENLKFRIKERDDFVTALQTNMQRFK